MKIEIPGLKIDNALALGPMAGVTDKPFRLLCKEYGCGLMYTEMVSAKAILYKNKNTHALLDVDKSEGPIGVQLFGSDADIMADIAAQIEDGLYDFIDINMGCPVPKVVNNHEGSALMNNPKLVHDIVSKMVSKVHKPVTVKIRKGFNEQSVNAVEIAKVAEAAGASLIAIHGRTREQYYSGVADWDIIREVKNAVKIPVIGNGDIRSGEDARRMLEHTGCDGIMVGRAARGNPWIFREINEYLNNGRIIDRPTPIEVKEVIMRHCDALIEYKDELAGMREMRKHVAWYVQGMHNATLIRQKVNYIEKREELFELLENELR